MSALKPQRALLSVADKTGIVELARALVAIDCELIATGGTYRALRAAGLPAREVNEITGFPEIMGGRVKTLHPLIHGGILGRRGIDDATMRRHGIAPIDLVAVNLYPFEATVAAGVDLATAIEHIDIGGPAMLRAAAKNHADVVVVATPRDYGLLIAALAGDGVDAALRRRLAIDAFAHSARYDAAVAAYLSSLDEDGRRHAFPGVLGLQFAKRTDLRYGENPHQKAAFYVERDAPEGSIAAARLMQGKPLSFNNIADADAATECVNSFTAPACVIVKHGNPCGVAECEQGIGEAYARAYATDPGSAFGGIVAFNRELDATTAAAILERQFVEVLIAPRLTAGAAEAFAAKPNVRVLETGQLASSRPALDYKRVGGGLLVQDRDQTLLDPAALEIVSRRAPTAQELRDLRFAWTVAKFVKSNAIVYARDGRTVGIGAGQTSRVMAAKIAALKAAEEGLPVRGAVMASDAFFPFRDGIDAAAAAGITAVIQPGGSVRDPEVIAAADEHGLAMAFTGIRHFRH